MVWYIQYTFVCPTHGYITYFAQIISFIFLWIWVGFEIKQVPDYIIIIY